MRSIETHKRLEFNQRISQERRVCPEFRHSNCRSDRRLKSSDMRKVPDVACVLAGCLLAPFTWGQSAIRLDPPTGGLGGLTHAYQVRNVPPINLSNSPRLESLLRAGNLYLLPEDAVALALENNIDIEVQRYGLLFAQEGMLRARGGGALRSAGLGVAQGPQSVSLQAVNIAGNSSALSLGAVTGSGGLGSGGGFGSGTGFSLGSGGGGLSAGGGSTSGNSLSLAQGNGSGSSGGVVTQLGPPIPSFDPTFSVTGLFQHTNAPQSNTFLVGTADLVSDTRSYQAQYSQSWNFGLTGVLAYSSIHTKVNSPLYDLNPSTAGSLDLQLTQNLLQGFGPAVNGRNIRVQKNNIQVTDLQFKQQVIIIVSAVLNLYWDLASFREEASSRQREVEAAQLLVEDNKRLVTIGALPKIEVTRAEAQLYTAKQDLVIAETSLRMQEIILKNALSRNGVAGPMLASARVIPLSVIPAPGNEPLPPTEQLIQEAVDKRAEIAQGRLNLESNRLNLIGVKSSLKPALQAFVELTSNALTGDLTGQGAGQPGIAYLAGGYGTLLDQIARRRFPSYAAGFSLSIPIRNRAAQADYATSLLELRQNELNLQKNINQIQVEVQSAVTALQQARARYDAAEKAQALQEETLKADQSKNVLGAITNYQVVQDQRDLATANSAVTRARANYTRSKIALDQALGRTLEASNIPLDEAQSGHVSRPSILPGNLNIGESQ